MSSGFLPIVKPKGPTSAAIVGKIRRLLKIKKVGHTGTLDPAAEGVLVIALQKATSLIQYLPTEKSYQATIKLGITTTTLDGEGEIINEQHVPTLSKDKLTSVLKLFKGQIKQIPPMVSACHVNGQRLYKLARQGITIERQPRLANISKITLLDYSSPELVIDVTCSSGTYIRTLADDIGKALGCGAHLSGLLRTKTNGITLDQCLSMEQLSDAVSQQNWQHHLITPKIALNHMPVYRIGPEQERAVCHGRLIDLALNLRSQPEQMHLIVNNQDELLGLGYQEASMLKMKRVLAQVNDDN